MKSRVFDHLSDYIPVKESLNIWIWTGRPAYHVVFAQLLSTMSSPARCLNHSLPSVKNMLEVCVIGAGGVGTIAAYVLENSQRAHVTAILRSKYLLVKERGFDIESIDHGKVTNWRPHNGRSQGKKKLPSMISSLNDLAFGRSSLAHFSIFWIQSRGLLPYRELSAFKCAMRFSIISCDAQNFAGPSRRRKLFT